MRHSFIRKNGKILSIAAGAVLGAAGAAYGIVRFLRSRRRPGMQVEEGMDAMPDEGVTLTDIEARSPPILAGGSEEFAGMSRDRRTHRRSDNPRQV